MKILVPGAAGMLGSDVVQVLEAGGHQVTRAELPEFDIGDAQAVSERLLGPAKFDWCVNCAAYTAVDAAETHIDEATRVNTIGPGILARACMAAGTRLIHLSTDFVFDGQKATPYTEEDAPNPLQVYGRTKLEGEEGVLSANPDAIILRTSWLFGPNGKSFPRTILDAAAAGRQLQVVRDQIGTPTFTADLADVIRQYLDVGIPGGLYHAAGPDVMSWFDFARLVLDSNSSTKSYPMQPILTWEWPTHAQRPRYSALSCGRLDGLGITPMRPISAGVAKFLSRLTR